MKSRLSTVLCVAVLTGFMIGAGIIYNIYGGCALLLTKPAEEQITDLPLEENDDISTEALTEESGESQEDSADAESTAASPTPIPETTTYVWKCEKKLWWDQGVNS